MGDGGGGGGGGEPHALAGEPVEGRRDGVGVAVAAEAVGAGRVEGDEEDVGAPRRQRSAAGREDQRREQRRNKATGRQGVHGESIAEERGSGERSTLNAQR